MIVLIAIVGGVIIYLLVASIPIKDYAMDVDALKDPESLLMNSRVILKNTGKLPINDIEVIYDNNPDSKEKLKIINPGDTIILSPPQGSLLKNVHVKSLVGIDIIKEFRTPVKLPGMIGS